MGETENRSSSRFWEKDVEADYGQKNAVAHEGVSEKDRGSTKGREAKGPRRKTSKAVIRYRGKDGPPSLSINRHGVAFGPALGD